MNEARERGLNQQNLQRRPEADGDLKNEKIWMEEAIVTWLRNAIYASFLVQSWAASGSTGVELSCSCFLRGG